MVVFGRHEPSPPPKFRRPFIDGVDHQGPPTDQRRGFNAALECVFDQTCANALPRPLRIGSELAQKQTGNGIGRLARADRARQDRRNDGRWR